MIKNMLLIGGLFTLSIIALKLPPHEPEIASDWCDLPMGIESKVIGAQVISVAPTESSYELATLASAAQNCSVKVQINAGSETGMKFVPGEKLDFVATAMNGGMMSNPKQIYESGIAAGVNGDIQLNPIDVYFDGDWNNIPVEDGYYLVEIDPPGSASGYLPLKLKKNLAHASLKRPGKYRFYYDDAEKVRNIERLPNI